MKYRRCECCEALPGQPHAEWCGVWPEICEEVERYQRLSATYYTAARVCAQINYYAGFKHMSSKACLAAKTGRQLMGIE